jgi:hypothetical protein
MPKSHPPYSPEFRRRMVELVRAGRQPEALQLGIFGHPARCAGRHRLAVEFGKHLPGEFFRIGEIRGVGVSHRP